MTRKRTILHIPEIELPPLLQPSSKLGRNDHCWCGSGLKYKKCHLQRETATGRHPYEIARDVEAAFKKGYCSHPSAGADTCTGAPIAAHTVQKKGGIEFIQEDKHVLTTKVGFKEIEKSKGKPDLMRIGVNRASTFPGFCSKHDTELFQEIETKDVVVDKKGAFLLAFRAVAYESFAKSAALKAQSAMLQADTGLPLPKQIILQNELAAYKVGLELGVRDTQNAKTIYDTAFKTDDVSDFRYHAINFANILPVVACGAFLPEQDFHGTVLQKLGTATTLEGLTFNLTAFNNQSVAVFGWFSSKSKVAEKFITSFVEMEDSVKASLIIQFAFETFENCYVRPSWWRELPSNKRERLLRHQRSGAYDDRLEKALVDDGLDYFASAVVSEAGG
jgi:hypothetical protein